MGGRISLALTLHNHQPIGNFGWVIEEVFERAYRPMVEALEAHPSIRMGLHYTGPLLEWLGTERPAFLGAVRRLAERGQVEVLGGGLYEPVLAALPERDRIGQLAAMSDAVERAFGSRPAGAWLAERVWEPDLPTSLVDAGYAWTILDDSHFRAAAIAEDAMWAPYVADDQGRRLTVFGTEQGLRYRIPFHDVDDVIAYLRDAATEAGDRLGTMGDDGEKFGAWPGTFEHCWGETAWVERFFAAIEANADWLETIRPGDWLAAHPPIGRAAIPTGSYAEMGEWALPPDESRAFAAALKRAQATGAPEARWLRGAPWRNFQVKYREVNDLHKQMLRASAAVEAMGPGEARDAARDHLYRSQSNDVYWHGLFGGVYLAHLRAAALAHAIAAEDVADAALGRSTVGESIDADEDGRPDVRLATDGQVVVVDLDEGAGISAWDLRAARHALAGVLRRRPEAYHPPRVGGDAEPDRTFVPAAAASIHEVSPPADAEVVASIVYDDYERRSGLIRVLAPDASPADWRAGGTGDLGSAVAGPFTLARLDAGVLAAAHSGAIRVGSVASPIDVRTELAVAGGRLDPSLGLRVEIRHRGTQPLDVRLGVEWALTLLGGGGNPQAWWELGGERRPHDSSGAAAAIDRLAQGNDWLGVEIVTTVGRSADAWWAPIETVSNSESGVERVYQGSALLLSWLVSLQPGATWEAAMRHDVRIARERSLET